MAEIDVWNRDDMEPRVREILDRTLRDRARGPYRAKSDDEVIAMLERFFVAQGMTGIVVSDVQRMAGGASKEQFAFTLVHDGAKAERFVL